MMALSRILILIMVCVYCNKYYIYNANPRYALHFIYNIGKCCTFLFYNNNDLML